MADPFLIWVVDQDQLNPYVAYEGYVVRVPHNQLGMPIPVKYFQNPIAIKSVAKQI
jgi:hypothetical protein